MKTYRFFSIALIVSFLLVACGGGTPAVNTTPLKVSWINWTGYYPLLIAQEKGFFTAHGITVELTELDSSHDQLISITTNATDGAPLVLTDVVRVSAETDLRIVMVADASTGGDVIVAPNDLASVADLKGKRIGAVLSSHGELLVREMLRQNGISAGDVQIVNVLPEELPDALGKTVDAGHTYEPFASQAFSKGYKTVFSTAEAPTSILDVVAFRGSVIDERPNDVRAFVAAWFDAVKWWQENPTEANEIIARLTNQSPQDISLEGVRIYGQQDNLSAFAEGQANSIYESTQTNIDFFKVTTGFNAPVDLKKLINPSFLQ